MTVDAERAAADHSAAARLERWARAAERAGAEPAFGEPERRLAMLRVFGSARYLADLCLEHSADAARVLKDGAAAVLADLARDVTALDKGVGGADALYVALKPLKERADLAIGLAQLLGDWTGDEAASARTDVAERFVEAAVQWLARSAARRGDANADDPMKGVFVVAGGDLAHEDLAPFGALDLFVVYHAETLRGSVGAAAERAFVRLGAELRSAFEGGPSSRTLFPVRGPASQIGAALVSAEERLIQEIGQPQAHVLKRWFATARVVAGDRAAGGAFMETLEDALWAGDAPTTEDLREAGGAERSADPRAAFRAVADVCRLALGRSRVLFRAAPARVVFETAADVEALSRPVAERLAASAEFVDDAVARLQLVRGAADTDFPEGEEAAALARLCGFVDPAHLSLALSGAAADARNTLAALLEDPEAEARRYAAAPEAGVDAGKLEDLGFGDGDALASVVDRWMKKVAPGDPNARLSARAPGLLTAFGETSRPDQAVRLFDRLIAAAGAQTVFDDVGADGAMRDAVVDALGFVPHAVETIADRRDVKELIWADAEEGEARPAADWTARLAPPWREAKDAPSLEAVVGWRREAMARVAVAAATGSVSFEDAARVFKSVATDTFAALHKVAVEAAEGDEQAAGRRTAVAVYSGLGGERFLPGRPMKALFVCEDAAPEALASEFARRYLDLCAMAGARWFAFEPDVSGRPGGVAAPLAVPVAAFRDHVLNRALASEKIAVCALRAVGGSTNARAELERSVLAVAGAPRASDAVLREADRARSQRLRREPAASAWDLFRMDGGLQDLEFVVSALAFQHGSTHPYAIENGIETALSGLERAGLVQPDSRRDIEAAGSAFCGLAAFQAIVGWRDPKTDRFPKRLAAMAARAVGVSSADHIEPLVGGHADRVKALYRRLVDGRPDLAKAG